MNSNVNYRYKITYMTVKLLNISKDNKVSWTNLDANYALQQTFMIINHKDIIIRKGNHSLFCTKENTKT